MQDLFRLWVRSGGAGESINDRHVSIPSIRDSVPTKEHPGSTAAAASAAATAAAATTRSTGPAATPVVTLSTTRHGHPGRTRNCLSHGSPTTLRGLFEVLAALHILRQTFLLTELLEAPEHLVDGFALPGFDSNSHMKCLIQPWGSNEPRIRAFLGFICKGDPGLNTPFDPYNRAFCPQEANRSPGNRSLLPYHAMKSQQERDA